MSNLDVIEIDGKKYTKTPLTAGYFTDIKEDVNMLKDGDWIVYCYNNEVEKVFGIFIIEWALEDYPLPSMASLRVITAYDEYVYGEEMKIHNYLFILTPYIEESERAKQVENSYLVQILNELKITNELLNKIVEKQNNIG